MASFAPSRANVRAVALPIPEAPLVTNATLPTVYARQGDIIRQSQEECEPTGASKQGALLKIALFVGFLLLCGSPHSRRKRQRNSIASRVIVRWRLPCA